MSRGGEGFKAALSQHPHALAGMPNLGRRGNRVENGQAEAVAKGAS